MHAGCAPKNCIKKVIFAMCGGIGASSTRPPSYLFNRDIFLNFFSFHFRAVVGWEPEKEWFNALFPPVLRLIVICAVKGGEL